MSLFDYASKVISEKVQEKSPMLSVSMGMKPVMPMAQGGGLSTVQNSLNINGEPHRLAYINPSEESLLQQLGGSGRKIDGIPTYDIGDDGGPSGNPDDDVGGFGDMGLGGYSPSQSAAVTESLDTAIAEANAEAAATGEQAAYDDKGSQAFGLGFGGSQGAPGVESLEAFYAKENLNRQDFKEQKGLVQSLKESIKDNPLGLITPTLTLAKAALDSINSQKGFGMDPMGVVGEVGPETSLDDDDGTDAGGDDIIIREKIAAVKNVPVEEVTVEEVERAKRLTAAQRVTGTRLEDLLDDIYGSGKGAGLLGITTNNTGTA